MSKLEGHASLDDYVNIDETGLLWKPWPYPESIQQEMDTEDDANDEEPMQISVCFSDDVNTLETIKQFVMRLNI